MSSEGSQLSTPAVAAIAAVGGGLAVYVGLKLLSSPGSSSSGPAAFSMADQAARFEQHKATRNTRALDIDKHFDRDALKGKRVLVTGGTRGLGLALVQELVACGAEVVATCRKPNKDLLDAKPAQIVSDVDVRDDAAVARLAKEVKAPLDVVINNAGYFKSERESVLENTMDFADEVKTIDVCAVGPLRVSHALWRAGLIKPGGKIAVITSQGGSIAWRDVQCPNGGDYGHHMSKAAANMMAKLLANELSGKASVAILHPGFNRTDMTSKYSEIWDEQGAVDPRVGAKRVLHEINQLRLTNSGRFINCEDGKLIPW